MRHRVIGPAVAVLAIALVAVGCGSSWSGSSGTSPSALLRQAVAAAERTGGMHLDSRITQGSITVEYVSDVSSKDGQREIDGPGSASASERLVAPTGYFQANATALVSRIGFPETLVSKLADRWVAVQPGEPGYASVTGGLTIETALQQITPSKGIAELSPRTVDGRRVVGVRGRVPGGTGTLYISTSSHLPVQFTGKSGQVSEVLSLGGWGEKVVVAVPPDPVPVNVKS